VTPARPVTPVRPATPAGQQRVSGAVRRPASVTGGYGAARAAAAAMSPEQRRAQALDYLERARRQLAVGEYARSLSLVDTALMVDPTLSESHELRRQIDRVWAESELAGPASTGGAGT